MSLKNYLKKQFPNDFRTLKFKKPSQSILNIESDRFDKNTLFFGGPDWENIESDIARIDKNNLEYFFLCLFTVSVIDLTMFTYYKANHSVFRSKTMYPQFAWIGSGPHIEKPKKLLSVPLNKNIVDFSNAKEHIDEYIDLFIDECNGFFSKNILEIKTNDFISSMLSDRDLQLKPEDQNTIIELIVNNLKKRIGQL